MREQPGLTMWRGDQVRDFWALDRDFVQGFTVWVPTARLGRVMARGITVAFPIVAALAILEPASAAVRLASHLLLILSCLRHGSAQRVFGHPR